VRIVFFLLLLANLALFAWTYLGSGHASDEPQLMNQQLNPQEIRLLSSEQIAKLAAERAKQAAERPKTPPKISVAACLELGGFNPGDVPQVQKALEPLALGNRLGQRRAEDLASYWVFMPPLRNRQAANLKAAELRKLGVEDFFIVQEDPKLRFARPRKPRARGWRRCARRAFVPPTRPRGKLPYRRSISRSERCPTRWPQSSTSCGRRSQEPS
jgi:hypothetical protein